MTNRQWRLTSRPEGRLTADNFEWTEESVPELADGQVLVRNVYLSMDPANRAWTRKERSYMPPVQIGDVMRGICVGVVEQSKDSAFSPGDQVNAMIGWQEYAVMPGKRLQKLPAIPGVPLDAYMGVLSHIGLTAYFGLMNIGEPQKGETLVVSAAAGAVGSIVGQIGKIQGMRVVGIAGTDEKCQWITQELGFDAAINYKTENVREALRTHCPEGVDVYFENVGGKILDAVLERINDHARIPLCGLISQYNATKPVPGPYWFTNLLTRRVKLQGFIVTDFLSESEAALMQLGQWMMEGRLKYRVDIVQGLENAPETLNKLFEGTNKGKLLVQVSEE